MRRGPHCNRGAALRGPRRCPLWGAVALACASGAAGTPLLALATGPEGGSTVTQPRAAADSGARLNISVDRSAITTVDRLTLRVSLVTPVGVAAKLPDIADDIGGFSAIARNDEIPRVSVDANGGATLVLARTLTLEPFLAGEYTIPALEARVGPPSSERVVKSEPIVVKVSSVIPSGEEPKEAEARGVLDPAKRGLPAWMLIAGALACGLVGAGVAWRVTRRTSHPLPPDAIALSRLGELERGGAGEPALAHEISIHLRKGLGSRLATPLDRLCTPEIAQRLGDRPDARETIGILEACDEIRFGGRSVSAEAVRALARRAADAITRAAPSVAVTPVSGATSIHGTASAGEGVRP